MQEQIQVSKSHYDMKYDHKARWLSYWYQIQLVMSYKPKTVLEVGLGNALVRNYLVRQGVCVTTIDIDSELRPDILGSVTDIPAGDNTYDVVLAAQIIEHLPYEDAKKAMKEIHRVCEKGAMISVPDSRKTLFKAGLHIPTIGWKDFFIKIFSFTKHEFDGQHYWEIGKRGFTLNKVKKDLEAAGFTIESDMVPADVPTKHFFRLEKPFAHK